MFVNEAVLKRGLDPNSLLIFIHCQRTGGSNFQRWISDFFEPEEVYSRRTVDDYKHWHSLKSHSFLEKYKLVSGFSYYRKPKRFKHPCLFLSNVRHPFYRVVSLFQMSQKAERHFMHDISRDGTLEDFYRIGCERRSYYFNNLMCKRIGGETSFEAAVDAMEKNFGLVGTTNHIDEMSRALTQQLGWELEPMKHSGKAPDEVNYAAFTNTPLFDEILENNQEDLKLFEYVSNQGKET